MFTYLCILLIASTQSLFPSSITKAAATPPPTTTQTASNPPSAIPTTYAVNYEAAVIFHAISLPLTDITDTFTLQIFAAIDANFGPSGLNLDKHQLALVKKTYLYLIFLAKLDAVQNNSAFKQYQSDFAPYLTDNNTPLPHIPDATLVKSNGWNNVTVTTTDISNSTIWQLFCKSAIANSYSFFYTALNIIHNVEQETFNYIPHIETSFYDHDYTNLRSTNEIVRIKTILETTSKDYYLNQCSDWNTLSSTKNTPSTTTQSLAQAITSFRKTPFYKNSHDIYELLGIKNDGSKTIPTSALLTPKQLTSPLKEQVWTYFMLNELLTMFYGIMTPDRLTDVLTYCSQSNLMPNVFPYTLDDYVYFEELLAIKCKTENNHKKSLHPSPPVYKKEETHVPIVVNNDLHKAQQKLNKNVKVQGWWDSVVHAVTHPASTVASIGSDIQDVADDAGVGIVGHLINNALDAAGHTIAGVAEGAFGAGVGILGNLTDVNAIKQFGSQVQKDAISNLQTATSDLQSSVNDLKQGLDEGVADLAAPAGDLVSIITDDKQLGEDMQTIINSTAQALANIGASLLNAATTVVEQNAIATYSAGTEFANLVASTVSALYTGDFDAVGENAEDLLNDTTDSIVDSFDTLLSAGEDVLGAVMQGLGAIINSLTTVFIDLSREVTYTVMATYNIAATIATGQDDFAGAIQQAKEDQNIVNNTLQANRQTINQVMGVAVAIGFTVMTEGAGAEESEEIIAASTEEDGDFVVVNTESSADTDFTNVEKPDEPTGDDFEKVEKPDEEPTQDQAKDQAKDQTQDQAKDQTQDQAKDQAKDQDDGKDDDKDDDGKDEKKPKRTWRQNLQLAGKIFGNLLNVAFSTFGIISGINGDALNELQEHQQTQQIINMWEFINDNKIGIVQSQSSYLKELQQKQQATLGNQLLALAFIKNITYSNINNFSQQISQALSKQLIPMLTPDANYMISANIGYTWGIQSNYLDLYPTQGFSTVTTGRTDFPFAQEVAQAPYAANDSTSSSTQSSTLDDAKGPHKFWFNQKVTALDKTDATGADKKPLDPLTVAIDLQLIYMIDGAFYTGIYLGGDYHDYTSSAYLADLTKNKDFDLDAAHLAKMVVLFRTSSTDPLQIGVYEHEGKDWIIQQALPDPMQLTAHHTYHINTNLNETTLTITVSIDNDTTNTWTQTVNVTALDNQRTYGIIASGAAVQWNQISPVPTVTVNTQARPPLPSTQIPEIEREQQSKKSMAQAVTPAFGSMKLTAISKQAILLGQYLYTTKDTNLNKTTATPLDYVVFATNQNGVINDIGVIPSSSNITNDTVVVSVITGNAYDKTGNIVSHSGNLWTTYQAQFGPFEDIITTYITKAQQQLFASLEKISFGAFNLDIVSDTALQNGQFIYTCTQTITATDTTGKPILDYLVCAEINGTNLGGSIGMPPTSPNAQGLVSLVTGNLYAKTTTVTAGTAPTPINEGYSELYAYENQFGNIDPELVTTIQNATTAYNAYLTAQQQAAAAKQQAQVQIVISTPATNSNLATPGTSVTPSQPFHIKLGMPPKGSISDLQKDAAGPTGFQLKLGMPPRPHH